METNFNDIIKLLEQTGYVFKGSQIYGGLANSWDYGPLGSILKKNIQDLWWNYFVTKTNNMYGLDSAILMNSKVWENSGHISNFSDPLIDCKECKTRSRADKLLEEKLKINVEDLTNKQMDELIIRENIKCPNCQKSNFTKIKNFNLMFETNIGVTSDSLNKVYLRPETAQGIFINFDNIKRSMSAKIPFGVAQIGKSFRNEITPGNFIFRTREFSQMEIEYFTNPKDADKDFELFKNKINDFLLNELKIKNENLVIREHSENELAHYAKQTIDFEYKFPFGQSELWGLSNRTDFDLKAHQKNQEGSKLNYLDPYTNEVYTPYVIEPSVGLDRLFLATILDAYVKDDNREYLKLDPKIAPYKFAVLPLTKKLSEEAMKIVKILQDKNISCTFNETSSIGKRYKKQDLIGTPYCITIDFDSLEDQKFTIRKRDDTSQERLSIEEIINKYT